MPNTWLDSPPPPPPDFKILRPWALKLKLWSLNKWWYECMQIIQICLEIERISFCCWCICKMILMGTFTAKGRIIICQNWSICRTPGEHFTLLVLANSVFFCFHNILKAVLDKFVIWYVKRNQKYSCLFWN